MKRFLVGLAKVLAALLVLLLLASVLLLGWLKWSGDREWNRVQAELRAKGEKLTFAELVPPMPPASENFFADPIWRELADLVPVTKKNGSFESVTWEPRIPAEKRLINQWMTPLSPAEQEEIKALIPMASSNKSDSRQRFVAIKELNEYLLGKISDPEKRKQIALLDLQLMKPAEPLLTKISELSKRPSAYFPLRYQDGAYMDLSHAPRILQVGQLLQSKSNAELETGDVSTAAADTRLLLTLSSVECTEPLTIPHLIRLSLLRVALDTLNRGIEHHQWADQQLTAFQRGLEKNHLLTGMCLALRGDRTAINADSLLNLKEYISFSEKTPLIEKGMQFIFRGYEKAFYDQYIQHLLESIQNPTPTGLNATTLYQDQSIKESLENYHPKKFKQLLRAHSSLIVRLVEPAVSNDIQTTIETQTQVNQTLIACTLERFRLAHSSYPASLDALVPEDLTTIPKEPTTGKGMHYRLLDDGKFLLWAPGWKLETLNGKPGEFRGEGDIVWNQPIPRASHEEAALKK